jgi:hypothetical protein
MTTQIACCIRSKSSSSIALLDAAKAGCCVYVFRCVCLYERCPPRWEVGEVVDKPVDHIFGSQLQHPEPQHPNT